MRLLDTTKIELHDFFDDDIPKYAILSHTWGDGEISYQNLEQAKTEVNPCPGYGKIRQCCQLARSSGYQYLWIDTCCIDKSSSAELSEAINSMYRWYRDSGICYAYLKDVSQSSLDDESSVEAWCASRWFTRGWTLQELLAPKNLVFFNKDWIEIGNKTDLETKIHLATGIEPQLIHTPFIACVAQKMSWASKRRTTRHEDRSYCLMGLFDVQMPLLYGEALDVILFVNDAPEIPPTARPLDAREIECDLGGQKAFLRLQYEIAKQSDDESLFAWNDASLHLCGVFAPSPESFVDSGDVIPSAFGDVYHRKPWSVGNRGLAIEFDNATVNAQDYGQRLPLLMDLQEIKRKMPFFHVLLLHCCRRKYPDQPFCVRLQPTSSETFARFGPGEVTMRDHKPSRALTEYRNRSDVDRRVIYIPQDRFLPSAITKFHTVFISHDWNGQKRPLTLWEPFRSEREWIMWEGSIQTLTMGLGTTIFCIEVAPLSFLVALTVATDMPDTLNLDVELNRPAKYSEKWFELGETLFQNGAAHMDTYHGRLSPTHQLDVKLRKGPEPGEGCWYVNISITVCEPVVPDKSQSHSNPPENNNRPSKSRRFKSIFS